MKSHHVCHVCRQMVWCQTGQTFKAKDENIQIVPCLKAGTWRGPKIWTWATSRKEISYLPLLNLVIYKSRLTFAGIRCLLFTRSWTCASVFACLCVFVEVCQPSTTRYNHNLDVVKPGRWFALPKSTFWNVKIGVIETGFRLGWFPGRAYVSFRRVVFVVPSYFRQPSLF